MTFSNRPNTRVILGTGGTIAGRSSNVADNVGYVAGEVGVGDLIATVPQLAGWALECEQVAQVDSKDMGFSIWKALAARLSHHLAREDVQGVVITHGTDTLEETALFLSTVVRPQKPVVLTCAMRPATALVPDGPQNLLDAVVLAGEPQASGVLVVCAGHIHSAEHVSKVHSYKVDAFDSGDAGPLGCIEEGRVTWFHRPNGKQVQATEADAARIARFVAAKALPSVALLTSYADSDGSEVRGLLALGEREPNAMPRGIVVACTGNGTLHAAMEAALVEAMDQGVRVVRSTRCLRGRVIPNALARIPESSFLSPAKARLALALELL